jgi:hypothetical protein
MRTTSAKSPRTATARNRLKAMANNGMSSRRPIKVAFIPYLNVLVAGPEYVIESKISLAQAAMEHTSKIQKEQEKKGSNATALNSSNTVPSTSAAKGYPDRSIKGAESDIMFEGTFKPQTALVV